MKTYCFEVYTTKWIKFYEHLSLHDAIKRLLFMRKGEPNKSKTRIIDEQTNEILPEFLYE